MLAGEQPGYAYCRIDNPTVAALGDAVADLHGAEAGIALATGMAAIHAAFLSLLRAGDRLLVGQRRLRHDADPGDGGVRTARRGRGYVDTTDPAAVEAALRGGRPGCSTSRRSPTRPASSRTCRPSPRSPTSRARRSIVDNTFASPAVCRPLDHGADLVVESATKYLSGHSDVMAGAVVGSRERIAAVRSAQMDTGATLGPFGAFLVLRGIATLAVRVERQSRTAAALAVWLEGSTASAA